LERATTATSPFEHRATPLKTLIVCSPWGKQLAKFRPRPFGQTLSEELRIGGMQFETRDQTPMRPVRFAQHSTFATTTRNLSKTAVVGSHNKKQ
jgi:hypothetical protein